MTLKAPRPPRAAWTGAPLAGSRPLVLGHRGASADAPENTLAAFRLAVAQGADGVELDVWTCATGEVVVIHDEDTLRVAGEAHRVPGTPLEVLRGLDVGAWRGERFRGEHIPLLAEVLEGLPGAVVNVELKCAGRAGRDVRVAQAAAEVIRRAGAQGRVIVSSFHPRLLAALRAVAPELARALLFEAGRLWQPRVALAARRLGVVALHPEARLLTPARARRWRSRGLAVNPWTVDEPAEVARLAAMGASALITNTPGKVRAALG